MSMSDAYSAAFDAVTAGTGGPWVPGDPWPDTTFPGGAVRDEWSGYIRLVVRARIASGAAFRMGPDPADRLNAGNVLSQAGGFPAVADPRAAASGLWVDLSCDVTDLEITLGATSNQGILSKAEAGTLTATLYDPTGKYDPLNPHGPYALAGQTRLVPGAPIEAFCEIVVDPATPAVQRWPLFTGTADRWEETWTVAEGERFAKLVASDETKRFVKFDAPEQAPAGDGDLVTTRLIRIVNVFGWTGGTAAMGPSTRTLQATTLAQSAWEMVNRTIDDELGFVWFPPVNPTASATLPTLAWWPRETWSDNRRTPSIELGCGPGLYDIVTDAQPVAYDALLHNTVLASRSGGTQQTVQNATSAARYGPQTLTRTDLGLRDDTQVATWGQAIVALQAYPTTSFDHVTVEPGVWEPDPWTAWSYVFQTMLIRDLVRVVWDRAGYTTDVKVRTVGVKHTVTPDAWQVTWQTVRTGAVAPEIVFHAGPHTQDRLDAGFQLGG